MDLFYPLLAAFEDQGLAKEVGKSEALLLLCTSLKQQYQF